MEIRTNGHTESNNVIWPMPMTFALADEVARARVGPRNQQEE